MPDMNKIYAEIEEDLDFEAYYYSQKRIYWSLNNQGKWITRTSADLKSYMRTLGYCGKIQEGEKASEIDNNIGYFQENKAVEYVGALAGLHAGPQKDGEVDMLITSSPKIIEAKPTEWDTIRALLEGMFCAEQLEYLYGWIHFSYKSLLMGKRTQGQALAIAGEAGCGKSLFQNLITQIMGGRSAKPYQYMTGGSSFNSDLFGAEHLMIEDEAASKDIRSRRKMGQVIKNFTVCADQRYHAKGVDAITLHPYWRLTITMNDEPENLKVLPPMDESIIDKIILLKARKKPMPMPTDTIEKKDVFWNKLLADLPGFLHHILAIEICDDMKCDRYGIKHYHHADILYALDAQSTESQLHEIIVAEIPESMWTGKASDLQAKLTKFDCDHSYEARQILSWSDACGTFLGRLRKRYPLRYTQSSRGTGHVWTIYPHKDREQLPTDPANKPELITIIPTETDILDDMY